MHQDLVTSQITLSAVVVVVMQWLKNSSYMPWLNQQSDKANRVVAALLAFVTAIGIHYTYDAGVVTITFTVMTVLHGLWHWLQSLVFQELVYKGVIKK